jgi:hypothetical protein
MVSCGPRISVFQVVSKEPRMAGKQLLSSSLRSLIADVAEKVVSEVYGEAPLLGTLFGEIEETGVQVGDAVACAVMQRALERQASKTPITTCRCGELLENPTLEPHLLTTRRGEVGWNEPVGSCRPCRRAFFPSEPSVGPAGR